MTASETPPANQNIEKQMVWCEVLMPHCRTINGTLFMLEPILSGILELLNDEDTRMCISSGYLRLAENTIHGIHHDNIPPKD